MSKDNEKLEKTGDTCMHFFFKFFNLSFENTFVSDDDEVREHMRS